MTIPEFVEAYLAFLSIVAVMIIPLSLVCVIFAWSRVRLFHHNGEVPGLMIVLAIISTMAFVVSTYAGVVVFARIAGRPFPAEVSVPLTATAFIIGELIPIIIMGYLIWRDRQSGRE